MPGACVLSRKTGQPRRLPFGEAGCFCPVVVALKAASESLLHVTIFLFSKLNLLAKGVFASFCNPFSCVYFGVMIKIMFSK